MTHKRKKPLPISKLKLGKLPELTDERTLKVDQYIGNKDLPPIPERYNWGKKIRKDNWGEMGNMVSNNCTCAAAGHFIMNWTVNTGRLKRPKDDDIMKAYSALTSYNPETHENDEGVEALRALKYWRKKGIAGHKIIAFAKLENGNREQLLKTIYLFGGCYVGLSLPESARRQYFTTRRWAMPRSGKKRDAKKGTWLGHAVLVTGYKGNDLRIITWGKEMIMTIDFWEAYADESYAVFSESFLRDEKTPTGVEVDVLINDLEELKKRKAGI